MVKDLISNSSSLCENLQGLIAQRFYVEMLCVDDKVTLTIDDTEGYAVFDADLSLGVFNEATPNDQRKRIHESVHDTVVGAYRALADAIETSEFEMTNVV